MMIPAEKSQVRAYAHVATVDQSTLGEFAGRIRAWCTICRSTIVVEKDGEYGCDWCGCPCGSFEFADGVWTIHSFQRVGS